MEPRSTESYLASDDANYWRYEVAPSNQKVSLKTIGGMQTVGIWDGAYGFAFVAYAPLIKSDKDKEELLKAHGWKKPWSQLVAEGLAPVIDDNPPDYHAVNLADLAIQYQWRDPSNEAWVDTDKEGYLQSIKNNCEVRTMFELSRTITPFATGGPVPAAGVYRVGEQPSEQTRRVGASPLLAAPYGKPSTDRLLTIAHAANLLEQAAGGYFANGSLLSKDMRETAKRLRGLDPGMYAQAATEITERTSRHGCEVSMGIVSTCDHGTYGCNRNSHYAP